MDKVTVKAGGSLQHVKTGKHYTVKKPITADLVKTKYGIYHIRHKGEDYHVDYTDIDNK